MHERQGWFLAGLFLTTFATLQVEILDTRLLSVVTWYHLSFLAVSLAMFGMAAGAVRVYLGGDEFRGAAAVAMLRRHALLFALAVPICHIVNLCIPIQLSGAATAIAGLVLTTIAVAIPFYLSGVVVATALTRIPGPAGFVYAIDLFGAALGSLMVVPLLDATSVTGAAFISGGAAALAAACFSRFAGACREGRLAALAVGLVAIGLASDVSERGFQVIWSKGSYEAPENVSAVRWTIHGQVIARKERPSQPFYWGAGKGAPRTPVSSVAMVIDGDAATFMTGWNGSRRAIEWIGYDVTSLPYHLRKGGDAAVIGVGGGRDVLTALWGESRSVRGIEINRAFIEFLEGPLREFSGIADQPEVTLVHDEARSYLTRSSDRFDVIQMSLIDTWAATGAGAFTLSENGLYTLEGWRSVLDSLKPEGLFSVSRWYSPGDSAETSRLLSLATASLLERGVAEPRRHLALVARQFVATLLVSPEPLSESDLAALRRAIEALDLQELVLPDSPGGMRLFDRIVDSQSPEALRKAVAHPDYDFSPPTDERPYFFNILKPAGLVRNALDERFGVIAAGNMMATLTLLLLWIITAGLVAATILVPLARSGRPDLDASTFAYCLAYFALIGLGFMFVQIPLMQRFSVYLGHPTYTIAVVLCSMILATGAGSALSDRLDLDSSPRWLRILPALTVAQLCLAIAIMQPLIDATIQLPLAARCSIVAVFVASLALPLGSYFPLGLRLVRRLCDAATPWMWGVNGAASVLASVTAVAVSMWSGISTSLYLATASYLLIVLPAHVLWQRANAEEAR
jgi:SAM-dependent methyltransferase